MENPEQHVVDLIAELVDESLAHGPTDDYHAPWKVRCSLCAGEWHGEPKNALTDPGWCPGAYASPAEIEAWHARPPALTHMPTQHSYTLADLEAMRDEMMRSRLQAHSHITFDLSGVHPDVRRVLTGTHVETLVNGSVRVDRNVDDWPYADAYLNPLLIWLDQLAARNHIRAVLLTRRAHTLGQRMRHAITHALPRTSRTRQRRDSVPSSNALVASEVRVLTRRHGA